MGCAESEGWDVQRVRGVGCEESEATQNIGSSAEENGDQGSMVEAGTKPQGRPLPSERWQPSLVARACDNPSQAGPRLPDSSDCLTGKAL